MKENTMKEKPTSKSVYVKRLRKGQNFNATQMSIIILFIAIAALISLWLPIYIANLPLSGS